MVAQCSKFAPAGDSSPSVSNYGTILARNLEVARRRMPSADSGKVGLDEVFPTLWCTRILYSHQRSLPALLSPLIGIASQPTGTFTLPPPFLLGFSDRKRGFRCDFFQSWFLVSHYPSPPVENRRAQRATLVHKVRRDHREPKASKASQAPRDRLARRGRKGRREHPAIGVKRATRVTRAHPTSAPCKSMEWSRARQLRRLSLCFVRAVARQTELNARRRQRWDFVLESLELAAHLRGDHAS